MREIDEELLDIKREIIESRGLVIKTNNLTNALGFTESEEGAITENQVNYLRARSVVGRTIAATLRYGF